MMNNSIDIDEELIDLDEQGSSSQKKKSKNKTAAGKTPPDKSSPVKKRRKRNPLGPLTILLALTTVLSLTLCLILIFYTWKNENSETTEPEPVESVELQPVMYSEEQVNEMLEDARETSGNDARNQLLSQIKSRALDKSTTLWSLLRELYPDEVVIYTGSGFQFIPVSAELEKHQLNPDNFVSCENGMMKYTDNGVTTSKFGIDVSAYQGNIDWAKVKEFGVDFAIIRVGYRGYGSGKMVEDEKYIQNIEGALNNGIEVGVYFFSQAVNEDEIKEEANTLLEAIRPYNITGPVVLDIEKIDDKTARGNELSQSERTLLAQIFCNEVRNAGYKPMIYGNLYSLFVMLDIDKIGLENIWFAYYSSDSPYYPYQMSIWQYSDSITIPGIEGKVDADILFP